MAKDQDAQFNVSSEVVDAGAGGGGVPYPEPPADASGGGALSAYGAAVDLDAMARADRLRSRAGITFSAPDRPELRNQYTGSIAPPWAQPPPPAEVPPAYPDPPPAELTVAPPSPPVAVAPATPAPRFDTYQDYRDATVDMRTDLANVLTQQGHGAIVGSKEFEALHQANLVSAGMAPPPPPPEPRGAYSLYREQLTGIETQTRDEYAEMGMGDLVGSPLYRNLVDMRAQEAGLIEGADPAGEPEARGFGARAVENIRDSFHGFGALNYGYAASQVAEGGARYYEQTHTGHAVTQEAQATAAASVLPGALAVAGTVAGAAFGGEMGAWAGGIVGAGAGSAVQGVVGANDQVAEATRQSAERLAAALGQASESVSTFRAQIEQTGAPAKDFATVLASAGGAGNFGPGTAAGLGALANAFGEYAAEDSAAVGKYAAAPINYGIGKDYAAGRLSVGEIDSLGFDAALQGDFGGLKTLQQAAQKAQLAGDPRYQAATRDLNQSFSTGGGNVLVDADAAVSRWTSAVLYDHGMGGLLDPQVRGDFAEQDRARRGLAADPNVAAQNALADTFAGIQARGLLLDPQAQNDAGRLGILTVSGGSVADVSRAGAAYQGDLAAQSGLAGQRVSALQALIASPPPGADLDAVRQQLAQAQTEATHYQAQSAGAGREVFEYGYGAETAGFGLSQTRAELSGASAADLLDSRRRQAQFLDSTAADPRSPLSPSERAGIEEQAARSRYAADRAVDTERQGELGVQAGQAGLAVAEARAGGTAGDVAGAQGQQIAAFQAQIAELTQELARGGLTVQDRIQRERELTQAQQEAAQAVAERRREYYATTEAQAQDDVTVDTSGLSRRVRVGGTASADAGRVDADYGRLEAQDRAAALAAPAGSREASDARARLATDTQRQRDVDDTLNVFTPGADTRTRLIEGGSALRLAEGAFRRSQEAPYAEGDPDANPFTRGRALEGEIDRDAARVRGVMGQEDAFRATRQREGRWDPLAEEGYQRDRAQQLGDLDQDADRRVALEHDRVFNAFEALPDLVAGSPGAGVSAGVLPTAAMAAFFTPGPQFGGFGRTPGETLPGAGAAVREGGVYGAFGAATGAGETVQVLRQILAALSAGNRPPLVTAAPVNNVTAQVSQQASTLDTYRRRP